MALPDWRLLGVAATCRRGCAVPGTTGRWKAAGFCFVSGGGTAVASALACHARLETGRIGTI